MCTQLQNCHTHGQLASIPSFGFRITAQQHQSNRSRRKPGVPSFSTMAMTTNNGQQSNMTQQDPRFQTFVAAFVPLQKLLNNNAISQSSYKAICAILEQELDNRPLQSEQEVISTIQTRAEAQVPPSPPAGLQGMQGMQGSNNSSQTKSRGLSDDSGSGTRGYANRMRFDLVLAQNRCCRCILA